MKLIYELRRSPRDIENLKSGMGWSRELLPIFEGINGVVGSEEWWASIEAGTIEKYKISGLVRGLWLGEHQCGPATFLMVLESGKTFQCDCNVSVEKAVEEYKLGRVCEIEYVMAKYRDPVFHLAENMHIILKISLGDVSNDLVLPYGPCHFSKSF